MRWTQGSAPGGPPGLRPCRSAAAPNRRRAMCPGLPRQRGEAGGAGSRLGRSGSPIERSEEAANALAQVREGRTVDGELLVLAPARLRRVRNAPMRSDGATGKDRTDLGGVVADGEDVIPGRVEELGHRLRARPLVGDPRFNENLHRPRI